MFTNRPNKCYKTEDGDIWHSRSVAVVGVVFAHVIDGDTYVLLTKRSDTMEDMPGRWCAPCGYLDWEEDLEHATAREICEETSLNVYEESKVFKYLNFNINDDPKSNRQNISIASAYLLRVTELPKISISSEASEVEWVEYCSSEIYGKRLVFNHEALLYKAYEIMYDDI